jgi:hypothetical protein
MWLLLIKQWAANRFLPAPYRVQVLGWFNRCGRCRRCTPLNFLQEPCIDPGLPLPTLCLQDKDRAKFGPEYGDRFCMLQLVGRHEMEKVQLQRESDSMNGKLMVSRVRAWWGDVGGGGVRVAE